MENSEELVDKDEQEYGEEVKDEMIPLKCAESIEKEESGNQRTYFAKFSNHELNHCVPSDMNHEITQKSYHSIKIIENYKKSHIKIDCTSSLDNYSKDFRYIHKCDEKKEKCREFGEKLHYVITRSLEDEDSKESFTLLKLKMKPEEADCTWFECLCDEVATYKIEKVSQHNILRIILTHPSNFKKCWTLFCNSDLINYCKGLIKIYKSFISYYGMFNNDNYEGFLEFCSMACPLMKLCEIVDHLKLIDNSKYNSLYRRVVQQTPYSPSLSLSKFIRRYKESSLFRFLFDIILSKVGNPQDMVQIEVKRRVMLLKDKLEGS